MKKTIIPALAATLLLAGWQTATAAPATAPEIYYGAKTKHASADEEATDTDADADEDDSKTKGKKGKKDKKDLALVQIFWHQGAGMTDIKSEQVMKRKRK